MRCYGFDVKISTDLKSQERQDRVTADSDITPPPRKAGDNTSDEINCKYYQGWL